MSLKMGYLIPIMCQEIIPGDSFKVNSEIMIRLSPMIAPIMHRVNVWTHYFFVPNRLIWTEWEDFITGGKDGTLTPSFPQFAINASVLPQFNDKTLADYLGLPTITTENANEFISALPFRAYTEIFNEYYRDQNLSNPIAFSKSSGIQLDADFLLHKLQLRAWEKDYFTSALPWTQRGPEVTLPIEVVVDQIRLKDTSHHLSAGTPTAPKSVQYTTQGGFNQFEGQLSAPDYDDTGNSNPAELYGEGTNSTINDLRRSVRLQEWLEKNARGGARYIEQLLSHFGSAPKDERLQRPEYLGGGKQPVIISEVLNTAGSNTIDLEPVGQMSGHGISVGKTNGFQRNFDEHGYVIGIMSVLPNTAYFQGIPKHFSRKDKLDFAWPEFGNLGEQSILNKELYFTGAETDKDLTFGYTPRYSEYKYGISTVHGEFKNNLDFWHWARKFANQPALNETFIQADVDKRVFAVTDPDTDDLYCQIYNSISAIRALPYFGTPTL